MKENIHWHKSGTNIQENQKIVEQKLSQMEEFNTNDDTFIEDQKTKEIIDGSNNDERKEYEDAEVFENAQMMYDTASKKYEKLNEYEEKLSRDYFDLDKRFDSLETLSHKIKILSLSVDYDKSRFNLSKGTNLSGQEMDELVREIKQFKENLFLASNAYERDLKEYETLNQTYSVLAKRYQELHSAWYPKDPELN